MSKKDCWLNHSRDMSTSGERDDYYYDKERSKATAKQLKFYIALTYKFKDNGIDLKTELGKRYSETRVKLIMNPSGRSEFSCAITDLIEVLTDLGLYQQKNDRNNEFVPTFVYREKNGKVRGYQEIVHTDEPIEQPKDKMLYRIVEEEDKK